VQFKRKVRSTEEEINLTPLIDVVFLLLIFFMVSTTFTDETHLEVNLPEAEALPAPANKQIEVVISSDGGYSVNGEALVNTQLSTLLAAIEEKGKGRTKLPFVITADAKVPYESVVQVMDAAGRLGYVNLSMTTKSPEGASPEGAQ
jgi:biopolymer transport protein ExbD